VLQGEESDSVFIVEQGEVQVLAAHLVTSNGSLHENAGPGRPDDEKGAAHTGVVLLLLLCASNASWDR
jgi:CRP-like cAMP-binding protein